MPSASGLKTKVLSCVIFNGSDALREANTWMSRVDVEIVNVETLYGDGETETRKAGFKIWYLKLEREQFDDVDDQQVEALCAFMRALSAHGIIPLYVRPGTHEDFALAMRSTFGKWADDLLQVTWSLEAAPITEGAKLEIRNAFAGGCNKLF